MSMTKLEVGTNYKVLLDGVDGAWTGQFISKLAKVVERKITSRDHDVYELIFENGVTMEQNSACSFEKIGYSDAEVKRTGAIDRRIAANEKINHAGYRIMELSILMDQEKERKAEGQKAYDEATNYLKSIGEKD